MEMEEHAVDVSSLIDVCFLLLIYFLVTSTLVKKEQDLNWSFPSDEGVAAEAFAPPLLLDLHKNGDLVINAEQENEVIGTQKSAHEIPQLVERLKLGVAAQGPDFRVVLTVDDEVDYQRFVDVLNCVSGAGVRNMSLRD